MVLKWCQPYKQLYINILFVLYRLNFVRKRTLLVKCPWGEMGDGFWSLVFWSLVFGLW